jgi:TonB family protein
MVNRRVYGIVVAALLTLSGIASGAPNEQHVSITAAQAAALSVYTPRVPYPAAARPGYLTRHGVFQLQVGSTGDVKSVKILRSTGQQLLDVAARDSLLRWRFKPGRVDRVDVPVTFIHSI